MIFSAWDIAPQLLAAFALDCLFGDPPWLPHPVRLAGKLAYQCEKISCSLFRDPFKAGLFTVAGVLVLTGSTVWGMLWVAGRMHPWLHWGLSVYLLYAGLALGDLVAHSQKVYEAVQSGDLAEARKKVGMIVGRETVDLDKQGVCRAAVESVAENIVDGVTAPLFWAALFGPVGIWLYKAVNTMDSQFGYKNERYLEFGWAAAKFDDLVNYLPARLTALFVVASAAPFGYSTSNAWKIWRRDRRQHASPNSGQTEAAVAGALEVQLGGLSRYFGKVVEKPTLGDANRELKGSSIIAANRLAVGASVMALLFFLLVSYLGGWLWILE